MKKNTLNIYKVERVDDVDYDAIVVIAASADKARIMNPDESIYAKEDGWYFMDDKVEKPIPRWANRWARVENLKDLKVTLVGKAGYGKKSGIILASYNAG